MDITVYAKDGSIVSTWQDVVKADLIPSTPPAIVFFAGTFKTEIVGIQTIDQGMYAKYTNVTIASYKSE